MRALRIVVVLGVAMICGLLALEMSGSARRTVATNAIAADGFDAVVHGGTVCQPQVLVPASAGYARVLIGTYYKPLTAVQLTYRSSGGAVVATGSLPAGAAQGMVDVPMVTRRAAQSGTLCLHFAGTEKLALGGAIAAPSAGSLHVNGRPVGAALSIVLLGQHPESWWQMLGTLAQRFGWGRSGWIGTLTFPLMALIMLGVLILAVRQLWRLTA